MVGVFPPFWVSRLSSRSLSQFIYLFIYLSPSSILSLSHSLSLSISFSQSFSLSLLLCISISFFRSLSLSLCLSFSSYVSLSLCFYLSLCLSHSIVLHLSFSLSLYIPTFYRSLSLSQILSVIVSSLSLSIPISFVGPLSDFSSAKTWKAYTFSQLWILRTPRKCKNSRQTKLTSGGVFGCPWGYLAGHGEAHRGIRSTPQWRHLGALRLDSLQGKCLRECTFGPVRLAVLQKIHWIHMGCPGCSRS